VNKRMAIVILGLIVGASTFSALSSGSTHSNQGTRSALGRMSHRGVPVTSTRLSAMRAVLPVGIGVDIRAYGEQDGSEFYTAASPVAAGRLCYMATVIRNSPVTPAGIVCAGATTPFPSAASPVLDMSVFTSASPDDATVHIVQLQGFATDSVKRIGVETVAGKRYNAPVRNNTYASKAIPASAAVSSIDAYDATGARVYSKVLAP
jgi:hypothetical protein